MIFLFYFPLFHPSDHIHPDIVEQYVKFVWPTNAHIQDGIQRNTVMTRESITMLNMKKINIIFPVSSTSPHDADELAAHITGNVQMLHVPSDHIWRPDIVLYNKWVACKLDLNALKFCAEKKIDRKIMFHCKKRKRKRNYEALSGWREKNTRLK